jgi:hypothetical protein
LERIKDLYVLEDISREEYTRKKALIQGELAV